jgi:DNA integrity scanning protein DisA with diadenylate cyclase activity
LFLVEGADSAATAQAIAAFASYRQLLDQQLTKWTALKEKELVALNTLLQARRLERISLKN